MNKANIKNFAVWARQKLISDITYKAGMLGITDSGIAEKLPQSTADLHFYDIGTKNYAEISGKEISQRSALVSAIRNKEKDINNYKEAFQFVVEEVAYTWFNRLIAIRFMEVNNYLPSGIRVLSSENRAKNEPDFVTTPFDTDLEFTPYEQDRVVQLKDENKLDELFRMLFIKQCNKLHDILPELFEKTDDYTELLLTISFTDKDGIVYRLTHDIDEDDFNVEKEGQVEIIGWMYQYYNIEPKEKVFIDLKKNIKITKDTIPAATQIFTPDWIVRYMVENSVGRIWIDGHPDDKVQENWHYYLKELNQTEEVNNALKKIKTEYHINNPEQITVFDPCMGSGHILVYAFDILIQIYECYGYTQRDAARNILEKNIYGLDVDDRAYQLAYFAIMMKARQYNRRILAERIKPNLYSVKNGNYPSASLRHLSSTQKIAEKLLDDYKYGRDYGSYLKLTVTRKELDLLNEELSSLNTENSTNLIEMMEITDLKNDLCDLINQAYIMTGKYDVVVTNPPYAGRRNLNDNICEYIDKNYPNSKMDLFSVFIEKNLEYTKKYGYTSYMTPFVWLYLSSFTSLRKLILSNATLYSYLQPEESSFKEAAVSICSFILRKCSLDYNGNYIKLSKVKESDMQEKTFLECVKNINSEHRYHFEMSKFLKIPDNRFVFWMSDKLIEVFNNTESFESVAKPRQGMATSDNNRFLRMWYEVSQSSIYKEAHSCEEAVKSNCKWFPYNKGGGFRKWFGNNYYVLNYENDGQEVKAYAAKLYKSYSRTIKNIQFYFQKSITWSDICGSSFAARACDNGFVFDVKGSSAFVTEDYYYYILALLNSTISVELLNMLNPSITTQVGDLKQMPFIFSKENVISITRLAKECVLLSKWDWDNFELSWDFKIHPLCKKKGKLKEIYNIWESDCEGKYRHLKKNEEIINGIFINIYGLENDMTPLVSEEDIAVRKADLQRDIKSLLSYAVGCMFGRYSLDTDGLAYAGGEWDDSNYETFIPDADNCIPITDEEYFEDDIVGLLCEWLKKAYGEKTLEDNLEFIANALGNKGNTSREIIRNYFLNDFIKDHIKIYQKRPIYWLFDSGKQNGFKALVYMHRWNADTIGNMRVEYLHRMQRVYDKEIDRMQEVIDNSHDNKEISAANKRKEKLQKQIKETKDYDTKVAHLALSRIDIDLDDGVKVNYEKVQTAPDGKKMQILTKL